MSTTPTADHVADLARRILGIMPRTRGQALDAAAEEIGILILDLCPTTADADRLAAQLTAHPWRRWNFGEFQAVAHKLATTPITPTEASIRAAVVPWPIPPDEYDALRRRAIKAGQIAPGADFPDVLAAYDDAERQAAAEFDRLSESTRNRLMRLCRAEFIARCERSNLGISFDRCTSQPYLDRNARDLANRRLYRRLVLGVSLYEPVAPAEAAAPSIH